MPQAPRRGAAPEGDGAAFEDEEQDGLEDLAAGAPALRFGRDLRLLEVRRSKWSKDERFSPFAAVLLPTPAVASSVATITLMLAEAYLA